MPILTACLSTSNSNPRIFSNYRRKLGGEMVTPRYAESATVWSRLHRRTHAIHAITRTQTHPLSLFRRIHLDNIKINLYLANSNNSDREAMYTNGGLKRTHSPFLSLAHSLSSFSLFFNNRKLITPSFTYIQLSCSAFFYAQLRQNDFFCHLHNRKLAGPSGSASSGKNRRSLGV